MATFDWDNVILPQIRPTGTKQKSSNNIFQQATNHTVLVVDDEESLCDILSIYLEDAGYDTLVANDGRTALAMLQQEKVDVIVSDIRMPRGNGIEFINSIKAWNENHPPLIFVTGYSDLTPQEALQYGAEEIIAKPIDYNALLGIIKRTLLPPEQQWKREFLRIDTSNVKAEISTDGFITKQVGRVLNISSGGLFIALTNRLPNVGDNLQFNIRFNNPKQKPGEGTGICRWRREQTLAPNQLRGVGVEFVTLDQASQDQIRQLTNSLVTYSLISSH